MKKKLLLSFFALAFCFAFASAQLPGSKTYDFKDGTIISNGKSDDGTLLLSGNYSHHGTQYGLNMKLDAEIKIAVSGSCSFKFLGSKHSSLKLQARASTTGDLGTQDTKVTTDLSDTYDFIYSGEADTITFLAVAGSANDIYLPSIEVIPSQLGASFDTAEKNIIYFFDFRDGSIIPTDTDGQSDISLGLVEITVGNENAYGYNGDSHGSVLKGGNQMILKVAGNSKIKIGGCTYSNGTVSVSSETGSFDKNSQDSQTATEYHNDGATFEFIYVGDAGSVTLDFTGTTYIPIIEIEPIPYEVELDTWVQKTGTVTINETEITYTSGENSASNPTVTVSDGTVISTTIENASVRIDLGGNALESFTPVLTGDIDSTFLSNDTLKLILTNQDSNPKNYTIVIADNSTVVEAEPGKTYTYNFADGSVLPQTSYQSLRYTTFITSDGILTMNSNSDEESLQYGYHDSSHGAVFFAGNSMKIIVAGNATITFTTCQYGNASDAIYEFTDTEGTVLGSASANNVGEGAAGTGSFSYTGAAGVLTATLKSAEHPTSEIYIHGLTIENAAEIIDSEGLVDVWDFGAEQLDTTIYKNNLSEAVINSWYDESITVGSSGNVLPVFSAGVLSWIGGGNDRLRTSNTNLTRYDENISGVEGYTGRVYVNSGANVGRYMSLALSEDDEVKIMALAQSGGRINFEFVGDPEAQTDAATLPTEITEFNFVAKEAGTYHIFDDQDKPSYYRIYRKDATYKTLTGKVDLSEAEGIPATYSIIFTNEVGKSWNASMADSTYSAKIPQGYNYKLSLADANGFIISNGDMLKVTDSIVDYNIAITKVELYTVSGAINGLDDKIAELELIYTPDPTSGKIYKPEPVIDAGAASYSVELEPNCKYSIQAKGVNDFFLPKDSITIDAANEIANLDFAAKPVYKITIDAVGISSEQLAKLGLTFSNLHEQGYTYSFNSIDDILLRSGTYTMASSGLDEYPLELTLTSNLMVEDAEMSKTLTFQTIKNWSFDDKVIGDGTTAYNGLLFTGSVKNEIAKGHVAAKPEATIQVPVNPGDKITVAYYYAADFSIEGGDPITTSSGSTSTIEYTNYAYNGTEAGFVTITIGSGAGTTYLTNISVSEVVAYEAMINVGEDKTYKTINEALTAIGKMVRENNERVTVMIDPGNYEEMLVITTPNITLKNAASSPNIALVNNGVDIDASAVRITSYYGHGYNYYSMGNDQKWNDEVLEVNKENGYLSYENKGSGTTNGSFWNATVVVSANGFEAEHIIFENSFNQYISIKESEDVVVMWESGNKGLRPTDYGNTAIQAKSFVERAAAIAITNNTDKVILNRCKVVGHQDSFYGGSGSRVVVYKGAVLGGTDYLFGAMTAVFYKTDLAMLTSDDSNDVSYITAAQHSGGRGYLMFECNIRSAFPGLENGSTYLSKPGYFGRPWQATTSEVVFFNTSIHTSDYPGSEGLSLIQPIGWLSTLGGESEMMYEYGTVEKSEVDNSGSRADWSSILTEAKLKDGTDITTFNFTKGNDDWDPIPKLIEDDVNVGIFTPKSSSSINIYSSGDRIYLSNVRSNTKVNVYSISGSLIRVFDTDVDTDFNINKGIWIVKVNAADGSKAVKVLTQ